MSQMSLASSTNNMSEGIRLIEIPKTDFHLRRMMADHYSAPLGFVGRSICYLVMFGDSLYGGIVGGSATLHLPGRNEYFGIDKTNLRGVVNNLFYHVNPLVNGYPTRNFTTKVLTAWRERIAVDWERKYGDPVMGFESLVELPRTGECYRRDGWERIGQTVGYTCKRTKGKGTDSWSGRRIWDTKNLRPKLVFVRDFD